MNIRNIATVALAAATLLLAGCKGGTADVKFNRFEQVLFDTPTEQLGKKLAEVQNSYNSPLLNVRPNDPEFAAQLTGFVSDPTMREIYRITDSCYHNLGWLEKKLGKALYKAQQLDDEIAYRHFYTMVTGDFEDYQNRVFCDQQDLVVALDHYILPYTKHMGYLNCPMYMINLSQKEYLAADCMAAIARAHIAMPKETPTLLDYIVMEGKVQYFLELTLPDEPDSIRLRYTGDQLNWMQHSEKDVWTYFVQNELLYNSDMSRIHNFIDDAPKTNAFKDSAPRTTDYIGREIVRRYAKREKASLKEIFAENDSQKILTRSAYRP